MQEILAILMGNKLLLLLCVLLLALVTCPVSASASEKKVIAAIDQGTASTRYMVFSRDGRPVASSQMDHTQIYPHPGWVEHDAMEIWDRA